MKSSFYLTALFLCLTVTLSSAHAITVLDFEGLSGTFPSYTQDGVTFTPESPAVNIQALSVTGLGVGLIGIDPIFNPLRADIMGNASFVSVLLGDASSDTDNLFLRAFDALDNQIALDTGVLVGQGSQTLSVTIPDIAYVIFGSAGGINNSSVLVDTFTFEPQQQRPVPEPITATLGLMSFGVLGFATRRRTA